MLYRIYKQIDILKLVVNIKLIMQSKSQSCDRCLRNDRAYLTANEPHHKTIKKPESYLSKKFQQLYDEDRKWKDKRKAKLQETIKKKEDKQIQGCTFKPQINNNPEYHVNNDPFLKREEDWKRNIDKKLAEKRQQKGKADKDCTFQPKISELPLTSSQVRQTKIMNTTNSYSTKASYVQKKSYKVLHSERKKFKQITKMIIVQPFKHRLQNSIASNHKLQNLTQQNESKPHDYMQQQVKNELKRKIKTQFHYQPQQESTKEVQKIEIPNQGCKKVEKGLQQTRQEKQQNKISEVEDEKINNKDQTNQSQSEHVKEVDQKQQHMKDVQVEMTKEDGQEMGDHMGNQLGGLQFQLQTGADEQRSGDDDDGHIETF